MFVEYKECFYIIKRIQSKKEITLFTDSIYMLKSIHGINIYIFINIFYQFQCFSAYTLNTQYQHELKY